MTASVNNQYANDERSKHQAACRIELAQHLRDELGLEIKPDKIRLRPGPKDPYLWSVESASLPLFDRQLSKQPTSNLKKLRNGIDKSFKAIRRDIDTQPEIESVDTVTREPATEDTMKSAVKDSETLLSVTIFSIEQRLQALENDYSQLRRELDTYCKPIENPDYMSRSMSDDIFQQFIDSSALVDINDMP